MSKSRSRLKYKYLENKLIANLLRHKTYPFFLGDQYPCVKSIAGNSISPDIDLLQIKGHPSRKAIGYEVKWLAHLKTGTSWYRLYQGIGQAFTYFLHGVHQAYLVLGWRGLPKEDIERISKTFKLLKVFTAFEIMGVTPIGRAIRRDLLSRARILPCLGFIAFKEDETMPQFFYEAQETFPISSLDDPDLSDEVKTKRMNLIAEKPNIKWKKKFLDI